MNKSKLLDGVIKGTLSLSLAALITKILGVVYKIPLSYLLGDEGMGYFNSAYTLYGFFFILSSAGIPKAVTMIITESGNESGDKQGEKTYRYLLLISLLLGVLLTAIFVIFAPVFSHLFGSKKTLPSLLSIAPSILFVALGGVVRGYLNACLKLFPIAVSQLIEGMSKLCLGLLFAFLGYRLMLPLELISALTILGITLGSLFSLCYMYKCTKNKIVGEKTGQSGNINKRSILAKLFKIAFPITLSSAIISIGSVLDLGIIMNRLTLLGYEESRAISLYGNYTTLAVPMLNLVVSILTPISIAYLPRLVTFRAGGNKTKFENELVRPLSVTAFIAAPCAFAYFYYSFDLLDILFDSSSAAIGAELLMALAPSAFLLPILTLLNTALEALGRIKASVFSLVVATVFKVVFSFFSVGIPEIGIMGVPLGTSISYLLGTFISLIVLYSSGIKVKLLSSVFIPLLAAFMSFFVPYCIFYVKRSIEGGTLAVIMICALSSIFYLFTCFLFKIFFKKAKNTVKIAQSEG